MGLAYTSLVFLLPLSSGEKKKQKKKRPVLTLDGLFPVSVHCHLIDFPHLLFRCFNDDPQNIKLCTDFFFYPHLVTIPSFFFLALAFPSGPKTARISHGRSPEASHI